MNPFKDIDPNIGLEKNDKSLFFGCFVLDVNQVKPFREPLWHRLALKFTDPKKGLKVYESLPQHLRYQLHTFWQKDVRKNDRWEIDCFKDDEAFILSEPLSDRSYIGMENFYFAFLKMAPFLENGHFFIYSDGDRDDRFMDEYKIIKGELICNRHILESQIDTGRFDFYAQRVSKHPDDKNFLRFTLYQLYYQLHLSLEGDLKKYPTPNSIHAPESELDEEDRYLFDYLYALDPQCPDLVSLEKKYSFSGMV